MLYSFNKAEPKELPFKIYLSKGNASDDEIADAGYVYAGFAPAHDTATQKATWDGTAWVISNKTTEELQAEKDVLWKEIREQRDQKINEFEWRISRYLSETRQGINPTTDTISDLDSYVQDLRNITKQTDPSNITWPTIPS